MGTRTHAWITVMAVAMLLLTAASCAMPEPIPFADSGPTFGDAKQVGTDQLDVRDGPPPSHLDVEGGLDSGRGDGGWAPDGVKHDGVTVDGVKHDGVKHDWLTSDGVKHDGVKLDGLTSDGPKKKLDGQKKPDGKP